MKYILSVEYQQKVTNCYDCPFMIRRQRELTTLTPQTGVLTYVERTVIALATCSITNEELNIPKKVGSKYDNCPLTVKESVEQP